MLSRKDLEPLIKHAPDPSSPILSLYLDVDLSRSVNRGRGILVAARAQLAALRDDLDSDPLASQLDGDVRLVESFLAGYTPAGKSLVLFCDASHDLLWHRTLPVPLPPEARYRPDAYLRPLLETLDEHERYGVVLLDRQQAGLFTVFLGEIEEHREAFAPLDVRSTRTTGTDHLFSEKRFHRRADEHAHLHIKNVASLLRRQQHAIGFDRLVIAGPVEATAELQRLLPRPLLDRVVATLKLPVDTRAPDLLREVARLEEERESRRETALVEELVAAARQGHQAVLGLEASLQALRQGRLLRLVYAADGPIEGGICSGCGTLALRTEGTCDFCEAPLARVRDLIGRMARLVSDTGGRLDRVRGAAADRLRQAGGPGGFLRF